MVINLHHEKSFTEKHISALLLLGVLVIIQVFVIADTHGDWWFEDDAPHRVFVRDNADPIAYFADREMVSKLSLGHSVTPWFPFTFWIDSQFSATEPGPAYLHTGFSLWLTACAFYGLMAAFTRRAVALPLAVLWLFLPSTVVITEFLSTRHYLEGLFWSILSVGFAHWAVTGDDERAKPKIWLAALFYLIACTTKEVYVSAVFAWLFLYYFHARRFKSMAGIVFCGFLYALYRFWSLDNVGKNLGNSLEIAYHSFLSKLPWMLTGNWGGYVLIGIALMLMIRLWFQDRFEGRHLIFLSGVFASLLVTILPVSLHLNESYQELGTWYRVIFLFNTVVLGVLGWLTYQTRSPQMGILLAIIAAAAILPGGYQTTRKWDDTKTRYREDAEFYLKHQDRLLYSELPAPWFLYGVHRLYFPGERAHYLSWRVDNGTPKDYVLEQTQAYETIWVWRDGTYQTDDALLPLIRYNVEEERSPLHKAKD